MSKSNKKFNHESFSKPKNTDKAIWYPDRDARVAKIVYQKAKEKSFAPGHELDDWIEAD